MKAYYNEIDPFAAAWLRELISAGHIAAGDVDERSIADVSPADIAGYTQCHFFAGIGVWSYSLRQAGWPDERPVWTGSCPCQPFSAAGKGLGTADERHLWPEFARLISECRPPVVFGEQVAAPAGRAWLHSVRSDLEGIGYAVGAADLCAAGVGAPHIRQRLYWLANSDHKRPQGRKKPMRECTAECPVGPGGLAGRVADAYEPGLQPWERDDQAERYWHTVAAKSVTNQQRSTGPTGGFWGAADWLCCRDGKWRPVESGTFPLADRPAACVGRLRGYGNAIVAPLAQMFITAALEEISQ